MEKEPTSSGMQFVLDSFAGARKRLATMKLESRLRDIDEIWEAYCDIEQSIEVLKFAFRLNRLGKYRRLVASSKNDPTTLPLTTLARIYDRVDALITSADSAVKEARGEDAIEWSRSARDQLKVLLLGKAKSELLEQKRRKCANLEPAST